jgi:aspartate carbamoyltransferase regulatory subunit
MRQPVVAPTATTAGAPPADMNSLSNKRYLVSAEQTSALAHVIDHVKADPALQLVDTIGPQQAPHTLVVDMNEEQAARLRKKFSKLRGLSIEPDQPLSPLGG